MKVSYKQHALALIYLNMHVIYFVFSLYTHTHISHLSGHRSSPTSGPFVLAVCPQTHSPSLHHPLQLLAQMLILRNAFLDLPPCILCSSHRLRTNFTSHVLVIFNFQHLAQKVYEAASNCFSYEYPWCLKTQQVFKYLLNK